MKISVVLATFNEEKNIGDCLDTVKDWADEIVVVDGSSTDKTVEMAKRYTDKILITNNPPIFHINKQKALDRASNDWILQLDADERVTPQLAEEINKVISMDQDEIELYQQKLPQKKLFEKHTAVLGVRDGKMGDVTGEYNAFFIPRLNYFLGGYLRHGGVYPDGVIRLVRRGKASFPSKSVHEQIKVAGRVGWLQNNLLHLDAPSLTRYLQKNNRYINLMVDEFERSKLPKDLVTTLNYLLIKPTGWFVLTQIRHKGFLDGWPGIVFSFLSALRFPRAFLRYLNK